MRTIIIGCESDHLSIRVRNVSTGKVINRKVSSSEQMIALWDKLKLTEGKDVVMFSSSMDFPKEYTSDKKILNLVKKLQTEQ